MTKEQALNLLMLLSSLESWAMSCKIGVPDHNRKQLEEATKLLTNIVLKETK